MTIWLILIIILSLLGYTNRAAQKGSAHKPQTNYPDSLQALNENGQMSDYERIMRQAMGLPPTATQKKRGKNRKTTPPPTPITPPPPQAKPVESQPNEQSAEQPAERFSEIAQGFTVEKAVIYSEILNPKFKEYE